MVDTENLASVESTGGVAEEDGKAGSGRNLRRLPVERVKERLKQKIKQKIKQRLKQSRIWRFGYSVAVLLAAVAVGLLPLLLLVGVVLGWYFMPQEVESLLRLVPLSDYVVGTVDLSWVVLVLLLVSPFCVGYANSCWQGRVGQMAGAVPAFLLWVLGVVVYWWIFGEFVAEKALPALLIAVLLGVSGGEVEQRRGRKDKRGETGKIVVAENIKYKNMMSR